MDTAPVKAAPRGIYSLTHGTVPAPLAAQRRYVAGLSVRTYWNRIELAEGEFDWRPFDETLALARAHGKRAAFRVMNGSGTPEWVYAAGARWYEPHDRDVVRAPVPWDDVFHRKWDAFVRAFGGRYDADPDVALVFMCMPAGAWAEIFHPVTLPEVPGYSFERFVEAHRHVIDTFAAAFPTTPLSLALTGHEKDGTLQRIAGALTDHLVDHFGPHSPRVYIQANGWSEVVHQSSNPMLAHTFDHCWAKPLRRGLQQVAGVQWQYRPRPDHRMGDQFLANAVLLKFGAEFAEVYEVDVLSEADQPPLEQLGALFARNARILAGGLLVADGVDHVRYTFDKSDPVTSATAVELAQGGPAALTHLGLSRSAYVRCAAFAGGRPVLTGGYPYFVTATFDPSAGTVTNRGAERLRYTLDRTSPVPPILGQPPSATAVTVSGESLSLAALRDQAPRAGAAEVRFAPIVTREDGKEIAGDVFAVALPPDDGAAAAAGVVALRPLAEPERRRSDERRPHRGEEP